MIPDRLVDNSVAYLGVFNSGHVDRYFNNDTKLNLQAHDATNLNENFAEKGASTDQIYLTEIGTRLKMRQPTPTIYVIIVTCNRLFSLKNGKHISQLLPCSTTITNTQ